MSDKRYTVTLKPCPFCGTIPTYDEDATVGSSVTCPGCKTDGPWKKDQESHQAIEAWNTRSNLTPEPSADVVEKCEWVVKAPYGRWAHLVTVNGKLLLDWTNDGFIATQFTKQEAADIADVHDGEIEYRR